MAKVITDDKHYKDIAQIIRDKDVMGNYQDKPNMKPEEMSSRIADIIDGNYDYAWLEGFEDGMDQGYNDGYEEGFQIGSEESYPKGVVDGKDIVANQGYNDFWDLLQVNGKRVNYNFAFYGVLFNKDNFKPKYSFQPTSAEDMFNSCPIVFNHADDSFIKNKQVIMKDLENQFGITFDFSKCTSFPRAFGGCLFSELNVIDMSSCKGDNTYYTTCAFYGGYLTRNHRQYRLKKIEKIIVHEGILWADNAFTYNTELTHIRFEGVIGNSINFKDSPLDKDSIINIFNHLSKNTTDKSLTLNLDACREAFGDDDGMADWTPDYYPDEFNDLVNSRSNWNIVLV